ncbi:ferredoxin family protein [Brenneria tiliae]|uniref:Ferredoxin-like protein n=1 Tax=Brenneria tiliae TaxID=2914984 RepID=A0ABT0MVV4_9GAMM|nr:ferredoxin family protein [Brenneria tiliae]MCL2893969.1 ferredoxin family protein [Brenneria tiliae]
MNSLNVEVKLGTDRFYVDEENPHIVLMENPDPDEFDKLILACPAGLYKRDEKGNYLFDYAGCLECGTCRVLCGKTILEKWEYPVGTLGVEFRHG